MSVDFGIFLPIGPQKGEIGTFLDEIAAYAEPMAGHVDSLWMSDHFFYGEHPTHEAWTVISYLAAKFEQFRLGTMVLGQGYRNPALLAKMGATLQTLTNGRLILGIGAGWKQDEYEAYGYDYPYPSAGERITQLEEATIIIKRLWYDEDPVSYRGRYHRILDAYCQPKPDPVPPIMIGGSGRKTLRVVAQHANWWNSTAKTIDEMKGRLQILHEHCDYVGRSPSDIRITWLTKLAVAPTEAHAKRLTDLSSGPVLLAGTVDQVIERIAPFIAMGVETIMFEAYGLNNPDVVGTITEDLLPRIRAMKS